MSDSKLDMTMGAAVGFLIALCIFVIMVLITDIIGSSTQFYYAQKYTTENNTQQFSSIKLFITTDPITKKQASMILNKKYKDVVIVDTGKSNIIMSNSEIEEIIND